MTSAETLAAAVDQAVARRRAAVIDVPVTGDSYIDIMPASFKKLYDERYGTSPRDWPLPRPEGTTPRR